MKKKLNFNNFMKKKIFKWKKKEMESKLLVIYLNKIIPYSKKYFFNRNICSSSSKRPLSVTFSLVLGYVKLHSQHHKK